MTVQTTEEPLHPGRCGDIEKLFRISAYCRRFAKNCRSSVSERHGGNLTTWELHEAEDEEMDGPAVNPKQSSSLTFAAEQVKPPRAPLPKFDGDILQFKSFWDQFESSIHQQEGLNDITKLLHLRSCLSGSALKAIEGVTICAENYPEVVQTLKTRFYRIPDVVESHVLSVMN
ncbi:hypothetical protein T03_14465, partial [Trichinella britovi]